MNAASRRRKLIAAAHRAIAARSPALALGSRLLGRRQRRRVWLLYAWSRGCSDLANGEGAIADIRAKTEAALRGEHAGALSFDALELLARECNLLPDYPRLMLEGLAMDAADFRPHDEEALYGYCHAVAGAPAALAAIACGVPAKDEATLAHAAELGVGCRLVAIARDISEDAARDRCYLPDSWLSEMDIPPGEHMKPPYRKRLAVLAERLGDRAEAFIASSRRALPALSFRTAWAALTVIGIHQEIIEDVVARGEHGWDHRAATGPLERIDKAMAAGFRALLRRRLRDGEEAEPPWRPAP